MRVVEPTKICPRCAERKPWSGFYAKVRWPDGTVRQPQSWCKGCHNRRTVEDRRDRRDTNRRYWAKYRADRRAYTDHLERRRFRYHIAKGTVASVTATSGGGKLDADPFVSWLRGLGASSIEIARKTGLNDRSVRAYLNGERQTVQVATVDRACLHAGMSLETLYPDG